MDYIETRETNYAFCDGNSKKKQKSHESTKWICEYWAI